MQIGQRLSQFFELGKFSQLSHFKRFAVVGLTALSSITVVGIIAAPFVWKGMTNLLSKKVTVIGPQNDPRTQRVASLNPNRSTNHAEESNGRNDTPIKQQAARSEAEDSEGIDKEEDATTQGQLPTVEQDPYVKGEPIIPNRLFETFHGTPHNFLLNANVGDYVTQPFQHKGLVLEAMTIKAEEGQNPIRVIIRKSSQGDGYYRYLMKDGSLSMPLTKAQISMMLRLEKSLPPGFRISGLSELIKHTGYKIFTQSPATGGKFYFAVNPAGALEELSAEKLTLLFSAVLNKKDLEILLSKLKGRL